MCNHFGAATFGITVLILLPGYIYTPNSCLGPDVQKITCLKGCMLLLYNNFFKNIFVVIIYVKCLLSSRLIDFDPFRQLESVAQKLPFITFRRCSVFPASRCMWEHSYVKTRMTSMRKTNVMWLKHFQDTFSEIYYCSCPIAVFHVCSIRTMYLRWYLNVRNSELQEDGWPSYLTYLIRYHEGQS
jgi:hypothetical protein